MELLPRSHKEFGSVSYWEKFFRKRGQKAFEWYGEYPELCGILHKYIKPKDKVLHIGCGNSKLGADLCDVGYTHIVNIDISATVIKQMTDQYKVTRPQLKFVKMDMCQMEFEDGEFNVVLDKGTLDAVFTDTSDATMTTVDNMFAEIGRVLRFGGRFVCISLAQEHILKKITEYFPKQGWLTRVCYVPQGDSDVERDFHMPVFAYVFTKFKPMPNMKPILEIAAFEDKVERVESVEKLVGAVKQLQNYGLIRQQLNKGTTGLDEHISLQLHNADIKAPRYTLHIVDGKAAKRNKFAIFIVPQGRENDWMFSEKAGREELCESAGFQRLLVVTLHRQHTYDSMEQVKAELSSKVMQLAPEKVHPKQVPYLSLGDNICFRTVRYEGESVLRGPYVVEDTQIDQQFYRRLVFLNRTHILEADAKLIKEAKPKAGGKPGYVLQDTLCQAHHKTMVAGLALVHDLHHLLEVRLDVLMVGLGGGRLATHIHKHLNKAFIEVVEQDASMVSTATEWFGFKQDSRLTVHTSNETEHIHALATSDEKKHVVMIDTTNTEESCSTHRPAPGLLEHALLQSISHILHSTGILMVHLSTKDSSTRNETLQRLSSTFNPIYNKQLPSKGQEVVFALSKSRTDNTGSYLHEEELSDTLKSQLLDFEKYFTKVKPGLDLTEAMTGLSLQ